MFKFNQNKDLVFVDIEANDFPKKILQFAAIKQKSDGSIDKKNWFGNPKCKITPHIFRIVAKNISQIEKGMNQIRIVEKIKKYLNNTVLISYGQFDYVFLNDRVKQYFKTKLNVEFIDLQDEWKRIAMTKEVWALNKLASFFGINVDKEKLHDASYDVSLLYQIFVAWQKVDNEKITKMIYKFNANKIRSTSLKQNKTNQKAITMNNIDDQSGFCFIKIKFDDYLKNDTKEKLLSRLDVLETSFNGINRNWSFSYDVNENNFDFDDYIDQLKRALKKYIISIRNKKIIIGESSFHKLVKINNLCAFYLQLFPLNLIMFTNGYKNLYSKINVENERFMENLELIKNWKVFLYIYNELD